MSKRILLTLILFFLITTIKSEDEEATMDEGEEMDDYVYDNYDGEQYFKEIVKEYLERNNLWQNDKLIQPDELKKIFLDIIADGEEDSEPRFKEAFDKLADFFIDKYYKEKKEIRGKDVYDLIGITEKMANDYNKKNEKIKTEEIYSDNIQNNIKKENIKIYKEESSLNLLCILLSIIFIIIIFILYKIFH